jgi:hypothetical protein
MTGWKSWSIGEVVEADDFQTYVQNQVVQNYADSTARTAALGTAVAEGMVSYLQDTNLIEVYDGSSWVNFTGDITGVTAGTALTGGGTSGDVTLNVDQSALTLAQSQVTNLVSDLGGKQATITGAATTITSSNLTASRALVSDGSGKVAVSAVTSTELGYVDGVTSNIQTQLNAKEDIAKSVDNKTANYTIVAADKNHIIRSTGSAITITIANVLAIGERIDFLQDGAGQITFAAGAGVTIRSKDSKLKTAAQYSGATIICVASGIYHLIGDLG